MVSCWNCASVVGSAQLTGSGRLRAQFYVLRKLIESELMRKGYNHRHAYIASLSSQTIVYKGQLMPSQVGPLRPPCWLLAGGCDA